METFILFRNADFASTLALKVGGGVVENVTKLLSITPRDGDTFMVDAHFEGDYADFSILKSIVGLQKRIGRKNALIQICSWFPKEYFSKNYIMDYALCLPNVSFKQLPL